MTNFGDGSLVTFRSCGMDGKSDLLQLLPLLLPVLEKCTCISAMISLLRRGRLKICSNKNLRSEMLNKRRPEQAETVSFLAYAPHGDFAINRPC